MWGYGWTGLMGLWMVLWGIFWLAVLGVVIWALVRSTSSQAAGIGSTAGRRNNRAPWLIGALVLSVALLLGGIIGAFTWGPYGMMGFYGPGGMMGGYYGQGPSAQGTPASGVTQVAIQNYAYQPAIIQVSAGTTVTWTNQDAVAHTVTFRNAPEHSSLMQQGQTYRYTFATPGTYHYDCAVHPYMVGTVIVT